MKNKKIFLLKVVAAMVTAFILLNLICIFYYNIPIHDTSKTHSTDYIWGKNKFYSRGTEGFASGVTDSNGFNNLKTFENGEIDVLVMGSSHMEAFNVAQDENTTTVLNKMFQASGIDLNAYNIGISSHNLVRCLNNFENAIDEFNPQEYIVIETQTIEPGIDSLKQVIDGSFPSVKVHRGIIGKLQKLPYLRLIYSQLKNMEDNGKGNNSFYYQKDDAEKYSQRNERSILLDSVLKRCAQICESAGVKLIIFYNCEIDIDDKGDVIEQTNYDDIEAFKIVCENNNIVFVNMYDSFKENYYKTRKLPRGFSNTKVGSGHLNEEGHRVIAEKLYSIICK